MLVPYSVRLDMSKPSMLDVVPPNLYDYLDMPACMPLRREISIHCAPFLDPYPVHNPAGVTVGDLIQSFHHRLHSLIEVEMLDEENVIDSPNVDYEFPEEENEFIPSSPKRTTSPSNFDSYRWIDLLRGEHVFIGFETSEVAPWKILMDENDSHFILRQSLEFALYEP